MNNSKNKLVQISAIGLFVLLTIWWAVLSLTSEAGDFSRYIFGASYGLMALFGGVFALKTAKSWGGFRSGLGKVILFLGLGLLLAEFGQIVFSYYNIRLKVDVPYPSVADIGFFGSIPLYIFGALYMTKVLAVKASIKRAPLKLIVGILVPLVILVISYSFFLKAYDPSGVPALTRFLDFGYPLGQAVYVSIALVSLLSVANMLGGAMRKPLMLLLLAFLFQYAADFNFLYQSYHETWVNGAYGDYLYLVAYFVMTLSLINLSSVLGQKLGASSTPEISSITEVPVNG